MIKKYANKLGKRISFPSYEDQEYDEGILPFLSIFCEATLRISGTSYVTSSMYMLEVVVIWHGINDLLNYNIEDRVVGSSGLEIIKKGG